MVKVEDAFQRIPQVQEFALYHSLVIGCCLGFIDAKKAPQVGVGTGVKKGREQAVAEYLPHLLLHFGREVIAAQVMQVAEVLVYLVDIGQ